MYNPLSRKRITSIEAGLFKHPFCKGSHSKGIKKRALHVQASKKTKHFIAKLLAQPYRLLHTFSILVLLLFSKRKTLIFSIDETFSQRGRLQRENQKSENVWSYSFIRGTKKSKRPLGCTVFKRKIGTMPLGYFLLVALYYCKII